jgi:hypothetical protein
MIRVALCLQLLLVVWILQLSDAESDQFSKLWKERDELQNEIIKKKKLIDEKAIAKVSCMVSCYYIFICRHCDTIICSPIFCEWLI